jgi:hypothetical protein
VSAFRSESFQLAFEEPIAIQRLAVVNFTRLPMSA